MNEYDFSGWATVNDLRCSDGRTIRKDAFKHCDGKTVPLVYMHDHKDAFNVLGHALLENRDKGVYAYCTFNKDTAQGKNAAALVKHGDVVGLSIYANQLSQEGGDVIHGNIRELSLVLAGANPGAYIDNIMLHGDDADDEAIIYNDEAIEHSEEEDAAVEPDEPAADAKESEMNENEDLQHADGEETVQDVIDSMNEKQKNVMYAMVGEALASKDNEEDEDVKHNVFDADVQQGDNTLCHADEEAIIKMAKNNSVGTFQNALSIYAEENALQHDDVVATAAPVGGFYQTLPNGATYGYVNDLFPDYKNTAAMPELVTNDQGWIQVVMRKIHRSPISRIRTRHIDIRNLDALRAKGYPSKGAFKKFTGNFGLAKRETDPQTIYVKNALHRDDIIDITDFDYVQYLYNIDKMMLDEEIATAILFGDGREDADEDKIKEDHIRPIWTDDELYTLHYDIDFAAAEEALQGTGTGTSFGENYIKAEAMVNACLYAREQYKGSAAPDMFIEPHTLNVMLLARDMNGRRIYGNIGEIAAALNVANIYTVEQMQGKTRNVTVNGSEKTKKLVALICNLNDYHVGATKGGEVTHFTQFDIDFNQQKSLLETRISGANTRLFSAIAIEEDVTSAGNGGNGGQG
jgi:HK97 family phage prohead protease